PRRKNGGFRNAGVGLRHRHAAIRLGPPPPDEKFLQYFRAAFDLRGGKDSSVDVNRPHVSAQLGKSHREDNPRDDAGRSADQNRFHWADMISHEDGVICADAHSVRVMRWSRLLKAQYWCYLEFLLVALSMR